MYFFTFIYLIETNLAYFRVYAYMCVYMRVHACACVYVQTAHMIEN